MAPILPATLRLPHPYLTTYRVHQIAQEDGQKLLQICHEPRRAAEKADPTRSDGIQPPQQLHSTVSFTEPAQEQRHQDLPPEGNNSFWAQARRSPVIEFRLRDSSLPSCGQAWLLIYAVFTLWPELEIFRLKMYGTGKEQLAEELKLVQLAVEHPTSEGNAKTDGDSCLDELVLLRSAFWQGAGSPFGPRPVWAPETHKLSSGQPLCALPTAPLEYMIDTKFPEARVHSFHPRRPAKPKPGCTIYSRYIPHLDEHFSMVALDYSNEEHLNLFHDWQNDPRVSAGWNETGTLEQHREYLRKQHEDAHQLTILAKFDDNYFAYFEVYWAKEDHFGAYFDAGDFDRGRHSLVGDTRFRGGHRVSSWWSSLLHYMFIDDPRTLAAVGEPKATNTTVLSYDLMCGFSVQKFVDLPHKRSACMRCSRERFFQLCPLAWNEKRNVGGTEIKLFAKL